MEKITSAAALANEIHVLEDAQATQWQQLKGQFNITYGSLTSGNLLRNTLNEVVTSPYLFDKVLGTALGLASGYFSRKLIVGASSSIFRKFFGSVLQFGITSAVSHNAGTIKNLGMFLIQSVFRKKK